MGHFYDGCPGAYSIVKMSSSKYYLQAAIFYLPFKIWSSLEGGLIASFGTDAKTPVIISADARYDDGVVMEAVVEKFVKYFKSIFHHNSWYFGYFIACKYLMV